MSVPLQNVKFLNAVVPIAADDATLTFVEIDTLGWDYLTVVLMLGATDIGITPCKLTDADVSATSHADITGTLYGTATDTEGTLSVVPSATDDDGLFVWELDLKKRKRYVDATITVEDGTSGGVFAALAILSRGGQPPTGITERGLTGLLRV